MSTEAEIAEMASNFAKYADLIVAFVVLQSLSFAYALGHGGPFKVAVLRYWAAAFRLTFVAGLFYSGIIALCGYWEHLLRNADKQLSVVLTGSLVISGGRVAIAVFATFVAAISLHLHRPKKKPNDA